MKLQIISLCVSLLALSNCQAMQAPERVAERPAIELQNDTRYNIRVNENSDKFEIAPGQRHTLKSDSETVTVKYMGSPDITATTIAVNTIRSIAQENNAIVHIVPSGLYGVAQGLVDYKPIKRRPSDISGSRYTHGLGESIFGIGITPAEAKAYKLLGVEQEATPRQILGVNEGASASDIKEAFKRRSAALSEIQPDDVNRAYMRIITNAYHALGGWF